MSLREVELLRAACCIAGLDGDVDVSEHPHLRKLADNAGVGAASLTAMVNRAEADRNFYKEQFAIIKMDAERSMKALFAVAMSDGVLSTEQRVILHHFAEKLGMDQQRFDELLTEAEAQVKRV